MVYTGYSYFETPKLEPMNISNFYKDARPDELRNDIYQIMKSYNDDIHNSNTTFKQYNLVTFFGFLLGFLAACFNFVFTLKSE